MKVAFVDIDGTLTDENYLREYFANPTKIRFCESKFKILKKIVDKYDLKFVLTSAWKVSGYHPPHSYNFNKPEEWSDFSALVEFFDLLKDYEIPVIGMTPSIPNPGYNWGANMWKDFDIQAYLIEHPEVTDYVIIDDGTENDIVDLKDHWVKTYYDEDGKGNGGLLPHHIDEVAEKLKPVEKRYTEEEMEDNELYKEIKYSGYNMINANDYGLLYYDFNVDNYIIHVTLSFDKKNVFFHWYDPYEEYWSVVHNYEEFVEKMNYFNLKPDEKIKKKTRMC